MYRENAYKETNKMDNNDFYFKITRLFIIAGISCCFIAFGTCAYTTPSGKQQIEIQKEKTLQLELETTKAHEDSERAKAESSKAMFDSIKK